MTDSLAPLSSSQSSSTGADVEVTGLNKYFGENHVLKDINFRVPSGTVSAIIGHSGSGKSTLLRCLNALEIPTSGSINIGELGIKFNHTPAKSELAAFRAQSGMVFQSHNLFPHKTVLENVVEGPIVVQKQGRDKAEADAKNILASLGLSETYLDNYPRELSGGQQQRVGIARALALHPKVLLFDEPTSALDPELVGGLVDIIRKLAEQGWTVITVTHDIRFARSVSEQILHLSGGELVEVGPSNEVLQNPESPLTKKFLTAVEY